MVKSVNKMQEVCNDKSSLTEERWQAIINNDCSYDDQFFYGVKTTGIFCRPSCKSKAPKIENVQIFLKAEHALAEHFRPCKRCKPNGLRLPNEDWVGQITNYVDMHFNEPLTLENLADICHGSPYHLQRTFKQIKGISPIQYIQQTRITHAKQNLETTDKTINEISMEVGIPNSAYFATLFKKITTYTPSEYRHLNRKK
ncbi:bifunctional transcriptional activator/DNA repair enzyme AdaA [Bacillaceae bacterium C204]|uniref:bifunctional transcriptional activator/DNA repair enzyme AdaA n=1 Tax=Neobacillus sp. 204 TaxID=3383351 RepID=UPI003978D708